MVTPLAHTQEACRIAGITQAQFNTFVHTRTYLCAPDVKRGCFRIFQEIDLICLCFFVDLKSRMKSRSAGLLTLEVYKKLQTEPDLKWFVIDREYVQIRHNIQFYREQVRQWSEPT